ncbi:MAG: hypothetical protein WKG00_39690 [Polyangiaceae bacterium]
MPRAPRRRGAAVARALGALAGLPGCAAAPGPSPRASAQVAATQTAFSPPTGAVERWRIESGGVLRASYERLRADQGAVGAAVLVAEGRVMSTADTSWFARSAARPDAPHPRRGTVAPVVARTAMVVEPVDLGALERVVILPPPGADELAAVAKAGFTGLGVRGAPWIDHGPRNNVTRFLIPAESIALSLMRVGGHQGFGGWVNETHAMSLPCGSEETQTLTAARWQTATPRAAGLEVAVNDGWFQVSRCRAGLLRSVVATARPIDSTGLVYALRTCESDACKQPGLLVVLPLADSVVVSGVGASREQGAATFVRLPLAAGSGSTVLARIALSALVQWERRRVAAGLSSRVEALGSNLPASVQVGVDVSAAAGEESPQVVVYRNRIEPFAR